MDGLYIALYLMNVAMGLVLILGGKWLKLRPLIIIGFGLIIWASIPVVEILLGAG